MQQLATGLAFAVPAFLAKPHPSAWTGRSIGAVVYLVIFGSIVGYSAYIIALERLPVSVVSIYNYVNPVIAVFLGWLFFREHIGLQEVIAMLIIFFGVALVSRYAKRYSRPARSKAGSSLCGFLSTASNRSPVRSKRSSALWMLNCPGSRPAFTSDQSSGVETGAPGCARRT